jgi:hypothetical protein
MAECKTTKEEVVVALRKAGGWFSRKLRQCAVLKRRHMTTLAKPQEQTFHDILRRTRGSQSLEGR